MSYLKERISEISRLVQARRALDVESFKEIKWELKVEETAYRGLILKFYREIDSVLNMVDSVKINGGEEFQQTWYSMAHAHLDTVEMVLRRKSTIEIRLAQIEGFKIAMNDQNNQLHRLSGLTGADVTQKLTTLAKNARAGSRLLAELTSDPKKYFKIAINFLNGKVKRAIPSVLANRIPSAAQADEIVDILTQSEIIPDEFIKANKFFKNASKWFGVAQVGLALTTAVFEALANEKKWAETFAKAAFEAGAGITLGVLISGTAVASVVNATLLAATITAEIPPVAAAVIAAGIVIVATMAVATLFDFLVDLIFGLGDIPPSMRLSMSTTTYRMMNANMSTNMRTSMVSLPK